jgi:hypothetical protein
MAEGRRSQRSASAREGTQTLDKETLLSHLSSPSDAPMPSSESNLHTVADSLASDLAQSLPKIRQPVATDLSTKQSRIDSLIAMVANHMGFSLPINMLKIRTCVECISAARSCHDSLPTSLVEHATDHASNDLLGKYGSEMRTHLQKISAHDLVYSRVVDSLPCLLDGVAHCASSASLGELSDAVTLLESMHSTSRSMLNQKLGLSERLPGRLDALTPLLQREGLNAWESVSNRCWTFAHGSTSGGVGDLGSASRLHLRAASGLLSSYACAFAKEAVGSPDRSQLLSQYKHLVSEHTTALFHEAQSGHDRNNAAGMIITREEIELISIEHGAHSVLYDMHCDNLRKLFELMEHPKLQARSDRNDDGFAKFALSRLFAGNSAIAAEVLHAAPGGVIAQSIDAFLSEHQKSTMLWVHRLNHRVSMSATKVEDQLADVCDAATASSKLEQSTSTGRARRSAAAAKLAAFASDGKDTERFNNSCEALQTVVYQEQQQVTEADVRTDPANQVIDRLKTAFDKFASDASQRQSKRSLLMTLWRNATSVEPWDHKANERSRLPQSEYEHLLRCTILYHGFNAIMVRANDRSLEQDVMHAIEQEIGGDDRQMNAIMTAYDLALADGAKQQETTENRSE